MNVVWSQLLMGVAYTINDVHVYISLLHSSWIIRGQDGRPFSAIFPPADPQQIDQQISQSLSASNDVSLSLWTKVSTVKYRTVTTALLQQLSSLIVTMCAFISFFVSRIQIV